MNINFPYNLELVEANTMPNRVSARKVQRYNLELVEANTMPYRVSARKVHRKEYVTDVAIV